LYKEFRVENDLHHSDNSTDFLLEAPEILGRSYDLGAALLRTLLQRFGRPKGTQRADELVLARVMCYSTYELEQLIHKIYMRYLPT